MSRVAVVACSVAIVLGACGGGSGSSHVTDLSIERETGPTAAQLVTTRATVHCDGSATATGFLANAAQAACASVDAVTTVAARRRSRRACTQLYGGPQRARVTGTIRGRRIDVTVTRTDGCGVDDWSTLEPLLGNPTRHDAPGARTSPSTTSTTAAVKSYTVRRGDTLSAIAARFGVTVSAIVRYNHLKNPDRVAEGQTLRIPPVPPVRLVAKPARAEVGTDVQLTLTGAKPGENVTFEIDGPRHAFTGPAHTASGDGVVIATYHGALDDALGIYRVVARGNHGTTARAQFAVVAPATSTT